MAKIYHRIKRPQSWHAINLRSEQSTQIVRERKFIIHIVFIKIMTVNKTIRIRKLHVMISRKVYGLINLRTFTGNWKKILGKTDFCTIIGWFHRTRATDMVGIYKFLREGFLLDTRGAVAMV